MQVADEKLIINELGPNMLLSLVLKLRCDRIKYGCYNSADGLQNLHDSYELLNNSTHSGHLVTQTIGVTIVMLSTVNSPAQTSHCQTI